MVGMIVALVAGIAFLYASARGWDKDTNSGIPMFLRLGRWWLLLMGTLLLASSALCAMHER